MPTVITHAVVAVCAAEALASKGVTPRFWALAVLCAILPDFDVIGFYIGLPYHSILGHRGFFHSPFFALVISGLVAFLFFREVGVFSKTWWLYLVLFFIISASHGMLDALTDGGMGIALLAPFDSTRYFFPLRPIPVSPIGLRAFFSQWGLSVLKSEIIWIWVPCVAILALARVMRHGFAWFWRWNAPRRESFRQD